MISRLKSDYPGSASRHKALRFLVSPAVLYDMIVLDDTASGCTKTIGACILEKQDKMACASSLPSGSKRSRRMTGGRFEFV